MKNIAKVNIFVLITVILASCYKPVEFVEVERANLSVGDNTNNELIMTIKIYNPNFYKLKITHSDLDLYINDTKIGEINNHETYTLAANDTSLVEMGMDINLVNIISGLGSLWKSDNKNVKIDGYVTAKTFFGSKNIRIEQSKNINK